MNELILLTVLSLIGFGITLKFDTSPTFRSVIGFAFLIFFSLSIYTCNKNSDEQIRLIKEKERADFVQDSTLNELDAKIEGYFLSKDTVKIKNAIEKLIHSSNEISPYENGSLFGGTITFKEYWKNKRLERIEEYNDFVEGAFYDGWFD